MMTELEKELGSALESSLRPPSDPVPLRAKQASLAEQLAQLEKAESYLLDRVRRDGVEAKAEADRQIADAHTAFERNLSEYTAQQLKARDETIRQSQAAYHARLHELGALLRRRS